MREQCKEYNGKGFRPNRTAQKAHNLYKEKDKLVSLYMQRRQMLHPRFRPSSLGPTLRDVERQIEQQKKKVEEAKWTSSTTIPEGKTNGTTMENEQQQSSPKLSQRLITQVKRLWKI